jgi:hypothetical protein
MIHLGLLPLQDVLAHLFGAGDCSLACRVTARNDQLTVMEQFKLEGFREGDKRESRT